MRILTALILFTLPLPAVAQSTDPVPAPGGRPPATESAGWTITVGIAPVASPAWEGSDDMILALFPDVRVNYGDTIFASVPDGIGWNAINRNGWKAGPVAKLRFGRDEDGRGSPFVIAGSSDALIGLGDVDAAAELGGFVERRFGAQREWSAELEVLRGFGGHEGVIAETSLTYQLRSGRAIMSVGPRATFASSDFTQTYFGIDADQALASGLAPYDADGGLVSYGLGGTLVRPIDRRSAVTVFTSFEMLGDVAADSPLVRERGRREQFSIGIGYGYRFGL